MQANRLEPIVDLSSLLGYAEGISSFVQSPEGIAFAIILLVPILITALARQPMATLLVLLLSFALLMLFAVPSSALTTLGVTGALSCYFVALKAIITRRRTSELNEQLANLTNRVAQLESVEQRRLLVELRGKQFSDQSELALGPGEGNHEGPEPFSSSRLQKN